jgi:hypothetical protein
MQPGVEKILTDVFHPNTPKIHPQVEIIASDKWEEIATLSSDCAFFIIHIVHTMRGDGVMIAFKDQVQNEHALGPFFGESPRVSLTLPPTSRLYRRARVHHIYAKLHDDYYVPQQGAGQARESGPLLKVEEWKFFEKQGQTDEKEGSAKSTSADSYISEVAKEQQ